MQKRSGKGRKPSGRKHSGSGKKVFPQLVGKVQMTREGFIFVIVEGQDDDIFVKAAKTRHALQGDTVRVAVTREKSGDTRRREGEVVEILERSTRPFVGYYHAVGAQAWVLMQSKSMPYDIQVDAEAAAAMGAKAGMKVAAVVDRWDRRDPGPSGHLVDVLGVPGDNDTEMHAILAEFNLPYRFSEEVEHAADKISDEITAEDLKGRKDFRDTFTLTIDPADAKDFDDALSFKPLQNGNYEIGVHIADVSYYVRPGSTVDKEARERGTSVYLVDRTVPMLPEKLCNKLCSLRPHEDKLTFSAVFEMTPKAEIKSRWIGRTVINSNYRLDYEQAQSIIEGAAGSGQLPPETSGCAGPLPSDDGPLPLTMPRVARSPEAVPAAVPQLHEAILTLNKLASIMKEEERKKGAIDFDRPEMKVEVDEKGKPVRVYQKVSKEANWLIEEFMLLANRTVAEFVATGGQLNGVAQKNAKTFVYRVHGEPNELKLEALYTFAKGFGHRIPTEPGKNGRATAKALNELLESAKGKPEFAAMENLALRAMAKACYSTDNIGHYGLAFKFYTHFTSPIRRYPDLMVHRLLALYQGGAESGKKDKFEEECRYASERELVAADAERTSTKYKLVEFMMDKIGEEYDGHVSGVTEWGMYVEIEPTKIEGMVSVRDIQSDFYEFDEARYRLVGKRSHKQFRLGDPVRIRVKSANLEQRLLDYELIESNQ
ncbi:MAG: RNB domain-containing ribonuclease [Bacteroidales bacterium]|nr:RNB domain-containing ribonuclease [Bacteroidales bacterium]